MGVSNKENNFSILGDDSTAIFGVVGGGEKFRNDQTKKIDTNLRVDDEIFLDILIESITGVCLPKTRIPGFSRVTIKF